MSRYWWVIALRGAVAILFGVLAFAWPGVTLQALVLLFGAYAVVDGAVAILVGIKDVRRARALVGDAARRGWWSLAAGIVTFP